MKSYEEFIKEVDGTSFDVDHVSGIQCVDLIKKYMKECFEINIPLNFGNAIDYYTGFEKKKLLYENFIKIKNTPEFIPEKGDIFVWNEKRGKGAGHVAICTGEGTTSYFYSYDLNWNNKKKVQKVKHDYKNVLGVLRKKKKEAPINYKKNEIMYVPVKDTRARDGKNSLVEFDKKQFWIDNSEFLERKSEIIGKICFEKQFTYGLAFHYYDKGIKKEFQFEVLKSICK